MSKFKLYTNCRKRKQPKAPFTQGGCHGEAVTGGLTQRGASLFAGVGANSQHFTAQSLRPCGPAPFTLLEPAFFYSIGIKKGGAHYGAERNNCFNHSGSICLGALQDKGIIEKESAKNGFCQCSGIMHLNPFGALLCLFGAEKNKSVLYNSNRKAAGLKNSDDS